MYVIEVKLNNSWGIARGKNGFRVYLDLNQCLRFFNVKSPNWKDNPNVRIATYQRLRVSKKSEL